jgi:hypothetical protein
MSKSVGQQFVFIKQEPENEGEVNAELWVGKYKSKREPMQSKRNDIV